MKSILQLSCFVFVLSIFACNNAPEKKQENVVVNKPLADFSSDEATLLKISSKVSYYAINYSDSLAYFSNQFKEQFIQLITSNPATFDYDFKMLKDSNICFINTSQDGNLKIYSWDDGTGGSMRYFRNIYQWKANGKVFTKVPQYADDDAAGFCKAIFSVSINNQPYYLVLNNSIYSGRSLEQSIDAFKIEGANLNDSAKVFKTKTKELSNLKVDYDPFTIEDENKQPSEMIEYNDSTKTVYVTVTDKEGKVFGKRLKYQLKDKFFEYEGIEDWKGKSRPNP